VAGDHAESDRGVVDRLAEYANLIERRREGDEPEATHATVRRLHADDAAKRRRLAHRSTGLGAKRDGDDARRDGCGRATRRATGDAVGGDGILRRSVYTVLGGRAHRELVHVGL